MQGTTPCSSPLPPINWTPARVAALAEAARAYRTAAPAMPCYVAPMAAPRPVYPDSSRFPRVSPFPPTRVQPWVAAPRHAPLRELAYVASEVRAAAAALEPANSLPQVADEDEDAESVVLDDELDDDSSDDYQPAGAVRRGFAPVRPERARRGRKRPRISESELRELMFLGHEFLANRRARRKRSRRTAAWR